jgi:hypothetical protein
MRYYKCSDIETVDGPTYNSCTVSVPEVEPSGNPAQDHGELLGNLMTALDITLDANVERFGDYKEVSWE